MSDARMMYEPLSVTHPGDTVVDYLEFNGWSQRDLARRTGLTPKTISEICNGKAAVTPVTSLALEKVLGRPAHFWLNLQRQYDEAEARNRAQIKQAEWHSWARQFPISEMKRFKWLEKGQQRDFAVDALLRFFGVSSPESWDSVWKASNISYRQTRNLKTSVAALSVWTRAAELEAEQIKTEDFDERKLRLLLDRLRFQTKEPAERFVSTVQSLCATAGVAVVWVPELKQTGISGCARWLSERKALIGMTLRYKTDDQIWFTFFHEIAHILLHRKRHSFILDNADNDLVDAIVDPQMQKEEEEANRFASDTLIPPKPLSVFIKKNDFSNEAVHRFSDELQIGPGIVIGRLQRERLLGFHQGNALKRIFNWNINE